MPSAERSLLSPAAEVPRAAAIPFKITGTTSNPVFLPDVSGMAGNMVKGIGGTSGSAASAAQALSAASSARKNPSRKCLAMDF